MPEQSDTRTWVLLGLGNPGPEYERTRHNLGARAIEHIAAQTGGQLRSAGRLGALLTQTSIGGAPVVLARNGGYMNLSGGPAAALVRYYKVPPEQLVVVHDDIDLAEGVLRVRLGGGAGGHNGLKDIIRALATPAFLRVRMGVGRPPGRQDAASYVLEQLPRRMDEDFETLVGRAAQAATDLVRLPLARVQDDHNH